MEDANTRQRLPFSFPNLQYGLLKFNSRENCQLLTNWTRWEKRDKVWSSATSLFKWRFCGRRRRCCLISLSYIKVMSTIYGIALALARQPYRIRLLFTHKNRDFSAVSVTERSYTVPILKVESHIWVTFLRHSLRWTGNRTIPDVMNRSDNRNPLRRK